jgi:hypothetical protein
MFQGVTAETSSKLLLYYLGKQVSFAVLIRPVLLMININGKCAVIKD